MNCLGNVWVVWVDDLSYAHWTRSSPEQYWDYNSFNKQFPETHTLGVF